MRVRVGNYVVIYAKENKLIYKWPTWRGGGAWPLPAPLGSASVYISLLSSTILA